MTIGPANQDQRANWNESSGRTWVELQPVLDRMLEPFAPILLDQHAPAAGGRALDIGCGAGATTLALARRLGPEGQALGVDISAPLVAAARARAAAEGLAATFLEADAQTHAFEPQAFDLIISRFGVMFFDQPQAAFQNIRRAARDRAALRFVAWRAPRENPFFTLAGRTAAPFLPPAPPTDPAAPGQFAFADDARVRGILRDAGWSDVAVEPIDVPCHVLEADLRSYVLRMGPVGAALRQAEPTVRAEAEAALMEAYAPLVSDGRATFTAACWLATASA